MSSQVPTKKTTAKQCTKMANQKNQRRHLNGKKCCKLRVDPLEDTSYLAKLLDLVNSLRFIIQMVSMKKQLTSTTCNQVSFPPPTIQKPSQMKIKVEIGKQMKRKQEKEELFEGDFLTDILPKSKPRNKKDVKSPSKPQTPRIPVKKLLVPEKVLWTGENTIFKPHWDSLILIPQFLNIKKVGIYKTFWQSSSLKSSAIPTELSSLVIDLSNILLYLLIHH